MTKRALISADTLKHNVRVIKKRCPGSLILAYVKANAYGHGFACVVPHLDVDMMAVADISEAISVRKTGYEGSILVQSHHYQDTDWQVLIQYNLTPLVHNKSMYEQWLKHKPKHQKLWLKYDTGMYRLGMYHNDLINCLTQPQDTVVMTHMAFEGEHDKNMRAISCINDIKQDYNVSICYAPTTILNTNYDLQNSDWIGPGLAIYGLGMDEVKLAMCLQAQVIAVKDVPKGEYVSYCGLYQTTEKMRVAIIAFGYADGMPQNPGDFSFKTVHGEHCQVIGQVSMDMTIVSCPKTLKEGDWLTIWSKNDDIMRLASSSRFSPYALLTRLGERIVRESCFT